MMRGLGAACVYAIAGVVVAGAQGPMSPELQGLVDAERAFARAATVKGIRDAFLEYFAEDSIAFDPAPVPARERLRRRPARPFAEYELRWEPRTGEVAASGELGWLTGPSTFIDHTDPASTPQPGNYLSVWRRQPDGAWRVLIDIGMEPPHPVTFEPGFTRFPFGSRYAGQPGAAAASLLDADRALNARIAAVGPASAYRAATTAASRLHRSGFMPQIGPAAIGSWLRAHASSMSATTGAADAARSGDLGYSYGTYQVTSPASERGAYVRVWQRDATRAWRVVADVAQKS